jgi:hypothetical protein
MRSPVVVALFPARMTRPNAPDPLSRVTKFREPAGALRDVNPLPGGVADIRLS